MSRYDLRVRADAQDKATIMLSALCVLHCLALPIAITVLPVSLLWLESEWWHRLFVALALLVSGFAIYASSGRPSERLFVISASLGLLLLTVAVTVERLHDFEVLLTITGATVLATAHVSRWMRRGSSTYRQQPGT